MSLSKTVPRFTGLKARFSKALLSEFSSLVFYVLVKIFNWTHLFLRPFIPFVCYNYIIFNNNKITFRSRSLHFVPQLSSNIQSSFTKVFVYVITSILQLVHISQYPSFIFMQMLFENYGTMFVFVMASFSSRYSVVSFEFYIVYFKFRF